VDQNGITPARLTHLRRATTWLDDGLRIPGTSIHFGLDPILGLIPGIGDVAGAALSAAILAEGARQGISRYTLLRMAGNVALDAAIGVLPVLGDLFDAAWKANRRNLTLLERHLGAPPQAARADRFFVVMVMGVLALFCVTLFVAGAMLSLAVIRWLIAGG
jgi:hypothetical protein